MLKIAQKNQKNQNNTIFVRNFEKKIIFFKKDQNFCRFEKVWPAGFTKNPLFSKSGQNGLFFHKRPKKPQMTHFKPILTKI